MAGEGGFRAARGTPKRSPEWFLGPGGATRGLLFWSVKLAFYKRAAGFQADAGFYSSLAAWYPD